MNDEPFDFDKAFNGENIEQVEQQDGTISTKVRKVKQIKEQPMIITSTYGSKKKKVKYYG